MHIQNSRFKVRKKITDDSSKSRAEAQKRRSQITEGRQSEDRLSFPPRIGVRGKLQRESSLLGFTPGFRVKHGMTNYDFDI